LIYEHWTAAVSIDDRLATTIDDDRLAMAIDGDR
jgi:hypothetical protein